jgi:sterol desaturase/sphingolipid hydroxylase (fatty acid hydroxylase superfamily)
MFDRISQLLIAMAPTRAQAATTALLLGTIVLMMILERRQPGYPADHRRTWKRDIAATIACAAAIVPLAGFIGRYVSYTPVLPQRIFAIPFGVRFAMFVVIGDFGAYWVHRAMHSKWLWKAHRWHHSPNYMYWLMGVRTSVFQQVLFNIPYLFAQALFTVSPWWTGLAIGFKNTVQSNWMHMNVHWGSRRLEWFVITPRYHHIHHSDNPAYYGANIAVIFPIWDRLFGTFIDPDSVPRPLTFGTNEKAAPWRLAIGV